MLLLILGFAAIAWSLVIAVVVGLCMSAAGRTERPAAPIAARPARGGLRLIT
jgi:hypothetical protein